MGDGSSPWALERARATQTQGRFSSPSSWRLQRQDSTSRLVCLAPFGALCPIWNRSFGRRQRPLAPGPDVDPECKRRAPPASNPLERGAGHRISFAWGSECSVIDRLLLGRACAAGTCLSSHPGWWWGLALGPASRSRQPSAPPRTVPVSPLRQFRRRVLENCPWAPQPHVAPAPEEGSHHG